MDKKELKVVLNEVLTIEYIKEILRFGDVSFDFAKRKAEFVKLAMEKFSNSDFVSRYIRKMQINSDVADLYSFLIWKVNRADYSYIEKNFNVTVPLDSRTTPSLFADGSLYESLSLIKREKYSHWKQEVDYIYIDDKIVEFLELFYPKPKDYELVSIAHEPVTKYHYSNESGIFEFINGSKDMFKSNLIAFGKTNEKPLAKTLNLLKYSLNIQEFYNQKSLDLLATDMLTRSFYFYSKYNGFKRKDIDTLEDFIANEMRAQNRFFISRLFLAHLKKVRFDNYYTNEDELFEVASVLLANMVNNEWVSIENIVNFLIYRRITINFEHYYRTSEYTFIADDGRDFQVEDLYEEIYLEPLMKGLFFYLGALGLVELKYDDPKSKYSITAKGKEYLSVWDGLKFVKLTELGLYMLDIKDDYKVKKIERKAGEVKFDEFKPIISTKDSLALAKIEAFTEKYDTDRYILSYTKIFKDCKNKKMLDAKIDKFYSLFDTKLPKVFDDYFNEIKANANSLKRDLKLITIELKNNKKLLNLFMSNKKLQDMTIKASGYRVLVKKEDIPKLTKIVKDNGFFVEF